LGISEFVIVLYGEETRRVLVVPSLILSAVQVALSLGFPLRFGGWVWLVQVGVLFCAIQMMLAGDTALKLPDWFSRLKLWMVELASFISLGFWLYWALAREFHSLFP
jgi:hypothetical protein